MSLSRVMSLFYEGKRVGYRLKGTPRSYDISLERVKEWGILFYRRMGKIDLSATAEGMLKSRAELAGECLVVDLSDDYDALLSLLEENKKTLPFYFIKDLVSLEAYIDSLNQATGKSYICSEVPYTFKEEGAEGTAWVMHLAEVPVYAVKATLVDGHRVITRQGREIESGIHTFVLLKDCAVSGYLDIERLMQGFPFRGAGESRVAFSLADYQAMAKATVYTGRF